MLRCGDVRRGRSAHSALETVGFVEIGVVKAMRKLWDIYCPICVIFDATGANRAAENFAFRGRMWSSGQSFWLQIQRSRVRFPALPDFLSSSGSGTGSTQPREVN